jgi:hypothetical protein
MRAILRTRATKPPKSTPERTGERRRWSWLPGSKPRAAKTVPSEPKFVLRPYIRPKPRFLGIALLLAMAVSCLVYGYAFGMMAPYNMVPFGLPILVLGALSVWALPELGAPPTKALERIFFVFFVGLLWPNYLAIALPGLPWITVIRLTGFPLTFLLLYSLSSSRIFRSDTGRVLSAVPMLWMGVAAFACYQTLSVGLSGAPQMSGQQLIATQISWTAIFFVSAYVFARPGRMERWVFLLWLMAVGLSFLAIREFMLGKVLWAGHVPSFLVVQDDSVARAMGVKARAGTGRYRVQTTFSSPLGLGEFLAMVTPFALHYVAGPFRIVQRIAAAISLPLILNAIILTDTRLGFTGFLIACVLYIFCWGALQWRQRKGSLWGPAVVLSYPAVLVAFTAAVLTLPRLRVMTLGGGQHQASTEAREAQVQQGIPLILNHPFGHGIGRGGLALGFRNGAGTLTVDTYYLLIALDYGIFGFLIFYGMFLTGIFNGFRGFVSGPLQREQTMLVPLTISLVCFFIIKSIYSGVDNQPIAFMMLGAIIALIYRVKVVNGTLPAPNAA